MSRFELWTKRARKKRDRAQSGLNLDWNNFGLLHHKGKQCQNSKVNNFLKLK